MIDATARLILDEIADAQAQLNSRLHDMGIDFDPEVDSVQETVKAWRKDNMDSTCPDCTDIGHSAAHAGGDLRETVDQLIEELTADLEPVEPVEIDFSVFWDAIRADLEPVEPVDLSEVRAWIEGGCQ